MSSLKLENGLNVVIIKIKSENKIGAEQMLLLQKLEYIYFLYIFHGSCDTIFSIFCSLYNNIDANYMRKIWVEMNWIE